MSTRATPAVKAGDGIGGEGLCVTPKDGQYTGVVIFLHGLGDTAMGWVHNMAELPLPATKIILPTAPSRPITINNGYRMPGWADVSGLSMDAKEDGDGFGKSAERIRAIIEAEREKGIPANKIVIGGFSQGGATALHVALRYPEALGGALSLSGWLPLREDYPAALSPTAKTLPVLMCHGDADAVVNYTWGERSREFVGNSLGIPVEWEVYHGMGHSANAEEMEKVTDFIRRVLQ